MKTTTKLFLSLIILLSSKVSIYSQCSGCTTNVTDNTTSSYTVASNQTLCIASGLNYTGTITLNGGTICNLGTLNNITFLKGNLKNYGSFIRPSVNSGLTGTLVIDNFEGSNLQLGSLTFSASNSSHIFQLNIYKGAIASFTDAVTHNSGNFKIEVGKENPGGSSVSTSTLNVDGLFTTKTAFDLLVNTYASVTFSNMVSLEGTGIKTITNNGVISCLNNLNMVSGGSSTSTVTINNNSSFNVLQYVNANYTSGKVFINNNATSGNEFSVGQSISLSKSTNTLTNNGVLTIAQNLNSVLGYASNNGTITSGFLSISGGTLVNNGFLKAVNDFSISNSNSRLNNYNTIDVGNTFTNNAVVNFGNNSYLYTQNYYNNGNSAAINGPTATISENQHPQIYISQTSNNSGVINKIMVYDASLTSTTSNIGYGFDAVTSPTRIAASVLFASKGCSPGNGNAPTYSCSILNYYLSEDIYTYPVVPIIHYGNPLQVSTYLYFIKKYNSNQTYESLGVPSDSYSIQPSNHIGYPSIFDTPLTQTTYTGSSTVYGCIFNDTITANLLFNVVPKITHTSNGQNNGSITLDVGGGSAPYTYTWMPGNIHTKDISNLAQGTYSLTIKDNNNNYLNLIYPITNKISWKKLISHMYYNNDSIGPNAELVSKNTLLAGDNGWMQFKLSNKGSSNYFFIGYLDSLSPVAQDYSDIDFGVYQYVDGHVYIIRNGALGELLGSNFIAGDVIKIEKSGTSFKIYNNNLLIWTENNGASANKNYKLKVFNTSSNYRDLAGASFTDTTNMYFPNYIRTKADIVHSSGLNYNDGSITLSTVNNENNITYLFNQLGYLTNQLLNIKKNTYEYTAKDNSEVTSNYKVNVNYKINYETVINGNFNNDSLYTPNLGYVMAKSSNVLKANTDGEVSYVVKTINQFYAFVGFLKSSDSFTTNPYDFDFGCYFAPYSTDYGIIYHINLNGSYTALNTISVGDNITIKRKNGIFEILQNGKLLFSQEDVSVGTDRKVAVAVPYLSSINNIGVSFTSPLAINVTKSHASYDNIYSGAIGIKVLNNTGKYSIKWFDNDTLEYKAGLVPGNYSVTVTDSLNNKTAAVVKIGLTPNWNVTNNFNYYTDSITKRAQPNAPALAISHNISYPTETAWFEHKLNTVTNANYSFGFIAIPHTQMDTGYVPYVVPELFLNEQTTHLLNLNNKVLFDSVSTSGLINNGERFNNLLLLNVKNDTLSTLINNAVSFKTRVNNGDELRLARNNNTSLTLYINDVAVNVFETLTNNKYLLNTLVANTNVLQTSNLGMFTSATIAGLSNKSKPQPVCLNDVCRLFNTSKSFDEFGNKVSESRTYFDNFGRPAQTQSRLFSTNNTLATDYMYDAFGRGVGQTLVAPLYNNDLCYKPYFFSNLGGNMHYGINNFDLPNNTFTPQNGEVNNPMPVGKTVQGQLGWYYSNNNTQEANVAADDLPYVRSEFENNPLGRLYRSAGVGTTHKLGSMHEGKILYENAEGELVSVFPKLSNELNPNFTLRASGPFYNTNLTNVKKIISNNADGRSSVTYIDNFGRVAATAIEGVENGSCNNGYTPNTVAPANYGGFPLAINGSFTQVWLNKIHANNFFIEANIPTEDLVITIQNVNPNLYKFHPVGGKIVFNVEEFFASNPTQYFNISVGMANGSNVPANAVITAKIRYAYTQWTLNYYDTKGRLKAVQSPHDVYCSPMVTQFVSNGNNGNGNAFNCATNTNLYTASLIQRNAANVMTKAENAKLSLTPVFNKQTPITGTANAIGMQFNITNNGTRDSVFNFYTNSYFDPVLVISNSVVVESSTLTIDPDTTVQPIDSTIILNSLNNNKQIRYKGKYVIGIKEANGNTTYFPEQAKEFDYTLYINNQDSLSQIVSNKSSTSVDFDVPINALPEASEVVIKNSELNISILGFSNEAPLIEFSPCTSNYYLSPTVANYVSNLTSNLSLQTAMVMQIPNNNPNNPPPTTPQFSKKFNYNQYDHLIASETEDEGLTYFLYDLKENKLRFSQNAEQRLTGKFSYISYDELGRTKETGEYDPNLTEPSVIVDGAPYQPPTYGFQDFNTWQSGVTIGNGVISVASLAQQDLNIFANSQRKTEKHNLEYDLPDAANNPYPVNDNLYTYGKVSKTYNENSTTWYKYNERGELLSSIQNLNGLGQKETRYTYDWRGKLLNKTYQPSTGEEIKHTVQYDADERPIQVNLVKNGNTQPLAKYSYYAHGAAKRTELGNKLQGLDYVYTLGGALKSINNPYAGNYNLKDPGQDGVANTTNATVKPDAFSLLLNYYPGDYTRQNSALDAFNITGNYNTNNISFTGQISNQRWKTTLPVAAPNNFGSNALTYDYKYDEFYRLKGAQFGIANIVQPSCINCNDALLNSNPLPDYEVDNITYDLNGNIKTLRRYAQASGMGAAQVMDNLTYNYNAGFKNRLLQVGDAAGSGLGLSSDIDLPSQNNSNNYTYNQIGQQTYNIQDNHNYLYNASGLVKSVKKITNGNNLAEFNYNDKGLRHSKKSYDASGALLSTQYYVYDEGGGLQATYDKSNCGNCQPVLKDYVVSGAGGRLGLFNAQASSISFELNDHLGNTRAVVTDNAGNLQILSYTDYYPHGGVLPQRSYQIGGAYPYAYQGQEKDAETGLLNFELRQYDARIGRWHTPDPYAQYHSPYLAMGNNPVSSIDPDGGYDFDAMSLAVSMAMNNVDFAMANFGENNLGYYDFGFGEYDGDPNKSGIIVMSKGLDGSVSGKLKEDGGKSKNSDNKDKIQPEYLTSIQLTSVGTGATSTPELRPNKAVLPKINEMKLYHSKAAENAWDRGSYSTWWYHSLREIMTDDEERDFVKKSEPVMQAVAGANPLIAGSNIVHGVFTGNDIFNRQMNAEDYVLNGIGAFGGTIFGAVKNVANAAKGGASEIKLFSSLTEKFGSGYKSVSVARGAYVDIKYGQNLNAASKGVWQKVFEAGYMNGSKVEAHYFFNSTTGQYANPFIKMSGWGSKAFKGLK